jgi:hypothetical protein
LLILKIMGATGAATTWLPKSKMCEISQENECFVQVPWELFGVHFGWSCFGLPILGPQDGLAESIKNVEIAMVFCLF